VAEKPFGSAEVTGRWTGFYRGSVVYQSTIDGEDFKSREVTGHKVYYTGHLDSEVGFISGRWIIRCRGFLSWLSPPIGWGTFELYKKS
jgi:hypothetical protein